MSETITRSDKFTGQGILDALDSISYFVDISGRILAVGRPAWNRLAAENGAGDALNEKSVIGRKLSDFIAGDEVRDTYEAFMDQLRITPDRKIVVPYRCDAPHERRDLRLTITGVRSEGRLTGYLFISTPISTQPRPHLSIFDFQSMLSPSERLRSLPFVAVCSYCQRVHREGEGHAGWVEAPEYYRRGGTDAVRLIHRICPDCMDGIVSPQL
jgi:hypothetical protein